MVASLALYKPLKEKERNKEKQKKQTTEKTRGGRTGNKKHLI
jgi:hypothetical protein